MHGANHSSVTLCIYPVYCIGSGERYLIHENGETKSIEFRIEASLISCT